MEEKVLTTNILREPTVENVEKLLDSGISDQRLCEIFTPINQNLRLTMFWVGQTGILGKRPFLITFTSMTSCINYNRHDQLKKEIVRLLDWGLTIINPYLIHLMGWYYRNGGRDPKVRQWLEPLTIPDDPFQQERLRLTLMEWIGWYGNRKKSRLIEDYEGVYRGFFRRDPYEDYQERVEKTQQELQGTKWSKIQSVSPMVLRDDWRVQGLAVPSIQGLIDK